MADNFDTHHKGLASPADTAFAVTPNDSADLALYTRGIYVGVAGTVKVDMVNSGTVEFLNLAAGVIHPIRAKRIYATVTGSIATGIVGVA
jgi:hypothetical protein